MIIAVLDTNVLASGFVRPEPPPGQLLAAWRSGSYTLALSEHILTELAHTFDDVYFRRRLSAEQRRGNLALLRSEALVVPISADVRNVASHPEDDLVLATAVSARAQYLVTGDRKLLALGVYGDAQLVTARSAIDRLTTARVGGGAGILRSDIAPLDTRALRHAAEEAIADEAEDSGGRE